MKVCKFGTQDRLQTSYAVAQRTRHQRSKRFWLKAKPANLPKRHDSWPFVFASTIVPRVQSSFKREIHTRNDNTSCERGASNRVYLYLTSHNILVLVQQLQLSLSCSLSQSSALITTKSAPLRRVILRGAWSPTTWSTKLFSFSLPSLFRGKEIHNFVDTWWSVEGADSVYNRKNEMFFFGENYSSPIVCDQINKKILNNYKKNLSLCVFFFPKTFSIIYESRKPEIDPQFLLSLYVLYLQSSSSSLSIVIC